MSIKSLTLGALALLATNALPQNHHNTHIVRKGETLEKIAAWTGVPTRELATVNHLDGHRLKPGLVLHIPQRPSSQPSAKGYAPYTIRKGDSDWKIANMFHMTSKELRTVNPKISWEHPHPGVMIRIPMKNALLYKLGKVPVIRSRYAVIAKPDTIVRAAPGQHAKRIVMVDRGRHVRVLDRDTHWYKVRFEYGTEGWVRGDLLAAEQPKIVASRHASPKPKTPRLASRTTHRIRGVRNQPNYAGLPKGSGDMLAYAQAMKGIPYSYGASSRHATDCSGFTLQVLRHEGVKLPRTAAEQATRGKKVDGGSLKPGDLVFFHTSRGSRISHVGIYVGNGKFIHASSGGGKVQVNSLSEGYYKRRFATARRVIKVKHAATKAEKIAESKREDDSAMKEAEKKLGG